MQKRQQLVGIMVWYYKETEIYGFLGDSIAEKEREDRGTVSVNPK